MAVGVSASYPPDLSAVSAGVLTELRFSSPRATLLSSEEVKSSFRILLDRALTCEIGLSIKTPNRGALRRILYETKRGYPEFDCLSITLSPVSQDELFIIKKEAHGKLRPGVLPVEVGFEEDNNNDPGG